MGVRAGWPDVTLVVPDQRLTFIELKTARGALGPAQKELHDKLRAWGADVLVARSVASRVAAGRLNVPMRMRAPAATC
jgi:hypothetical protein